MGIRFAVTLLTVIGAAFVSVGFFTAVDDHLTSVLLEVGAAMVLFGLLFWFERRLEDRLEDTKALAVQATEDAQTAIETADTAVEAVESGLARAAALATQEAEGLILGPIQSIHEQWTEAPTAELWRAFGEQRSRFGQGQLNCTVQITAELQLTAIAYPNPGTDPLIQIVGPKGPPEQFRWKEDASVSDLVADIELGMGRLNVHPGQDSGWAAAFLQGIGDAALRVFEDALGR